MIKRRLIGAKDSTYIAIFLVALPVWGLSVMIDYGAEKTTNPNVIDSWQYVVLMICGWGATIVMMTVGIILTWRSAQKRKQ